MHKYRRISKIFVPCKYAIQLTIAILALSYHKSIKEILKTLRILVTRLYDIFESRERSRMLKT